MKNFIGFGSALLFLTSAYAESFLSVKDFQNQNIDKFKLEGTKQVVLTFDDGPGPGTTKILNLLKQYGIKAAFFATGENIKRRPELAKRIVSEGHILANHSYDHDKLFKKTYVNDRSLLIHEVMDVHKEIVKYAPDSNWYYFRAPYAGWAKGHGDYLNQFADAKKYIGPIGWNAGSFITKNAEGHSVDAADWECWSTKNYPEFNAPSICAQGYLSRLEKIQGGVVLMHDIHSKTADMVEILIPKLIEKGFQFINLDQVEALGNYQQVRDSSYFK